MAIIASINQKGGVGKTTTAMNLACDLARRDYKTLIIDMDSSANISSNLIEKSDYYLDDLLLDSKLSIDKVSSPAMDRSGNMIPKLFIIPSRIKLASIVDHLTSRIHREKILMNHIYNGNEYYDYIILDCPPTLSTLSINAIYAASYFVVPLDYSKFSLDGFDDLYQTIMEVKEINLRVEDHPKVKILPNLFENNTTKTNNHINDGLAIHKTNGNLFKTVIRKCEAINQAHINSCSIFDQAPRSNGALDFESLTSEIIAWCKE